MVPNPRRELRAAIESGRFLAAPGATDVFTAMIIARAGCEAIYLGGNALAISRGKPQPLLTLDETCDASAQVCRAVDLPVIVDLGSGFGEAAHVHRAASALEGTGAAAYHIDDQPYPKRFGYHRKDGSGGTVPIAVMCKRLRAAALARRDPDLLIIARTDTLRVGGSLGEVIERGRAYREAGADALLVLDLQPEDTPGLRAALPGLPLVWIGGVVPPVPDTATLAAAGFGLGVYPFSTLAAIGETVTSLWQNFPVTGTVRQDPEMLERMRAEMPKIAGIETYWEIEQNGDSSDA